MDAQLHEHVGGVRACADAQKLAILKGRDRSRSLAKLLALWP